MADRKIVLEVSPQLDYLNEVVRQLRAHATAHACSDPMLKPLLERAASRCRLVDFSPGVASFRFDPLRGRHRRGATYEYAWGREWGYLRVQRDGNSGPGSPYPEVPPADLVAGQDLLDAANELLVQSVLDL